MSRENNDANVPALPFAGSNVVPQSENGGLDVPRAVDLAIALKQAASSHLKCVGSACDTLFFALEAGVTLLNAKEHVEHGKWAQAAKKVIANKKLPITIRTCQRYMKLADILLRLPGSPSVEAVHEDSKTTRASFTRLLKEHDLVSISSVLALGSKSRKRKEPQSVSEELETFQADAESELITQQALECVLGFLGEIDLDRASRYRQQVLFARQSFDRPRRGWAFRRPRMA